MSQHCKSSQTESACIATSKCIKVTTLSLLRNMKPISRNTKHLLDETESNSQFIASGQGNTRRSEAEPNIILYGRNQLDVG